MDWLPAAVFSVWREAAAQRLRMQSATHSATSHPINYVARRWCSVHNFWGRYNSPSPLRHHSTHVPHVLVEWCVRIWSPTRCYDASQRVDDADSGRKAAVQILMFKTVSSWEYLLSRIGVRKCKFSAFFRGVFVHGEFSAKVWNSGTLYLCLRAILVLEQRIW